MKRWSSFSIKEKSYIQVFSMMGIFTKRFLNIINKWTESSNL